MLLVARLAAHDVGVRRALQVPDQHVPSFNSGCATTSAVGPLPGRDARRSRRTSACAGCGCFAVFRVQRARRGRCVVVATLKVAVGVRVVLADLPGIVAMPLADETACLRRERKGDLGRSSILRSPPCRSLPEGTRRPAADHEARCLAARESRVDVLRCRDLQSVDHAGGIASQLQRYARSPAPNNDGSGARTTRSCATSRPAR
jgi:hypothetical protein